MTQYNAGEVAYGYRMTHEMDRVYFKEEVCMGCGLCLVHCQAEHSQSRDLIRAFLRESPKPLPRLRVERRGAVFLASQCRHCPEPYCVFSCLTGALYQDPATRLVAVDAERCIGCWTCLLACPYGAIFRDQSRRAIAKCDLCPGREVPACVAGCPNEALVFARDGHGQVPEAGIVGKG